MGTPENPAAEPVRFLKLTEVLSRLGISKSEAFRRIHSVPNFPKPIRMGTRCVVYSSVEVDAYMQDCIAKRDKQRAA
jgi:predicted DNA-binding transcriptional regulator AlpA